MLSSSCQNAIYGDGVLPRQSPIIDLVNSHAEIIDEFPAFSLCWATSIRMCFRLPLFKMLGIGVALNVFLGGWHRRDPFL